MNELALRVRQNPGTIEFNFEELNRQMDAKLAEYKGIIITEDTKDAGKADLAQLRRIKKDVEDARKSAKKEWMKPLEDFEDKMKKLSAKVDEPIRLIDAQLKEFEEARKKAKRIQIEAAYEELIGDMREYLPLPAIYSAKWENATTSMKSIKDDIARQVDAVDMNVAMLKDMQSDAVERALEMYKNTRDLAASIRYINNYEKQKAEIMEREAERRKQEEERRRREEEERARKEEAGRARKAEASDEAAFSIPEVPGKKREALLFDNAEDPEEEEPFFPPRKAKATYDVLGTPEDMSRLELFMEKSGIEFKRRDL